MAYQYNLGAVTEADVRALVSAPTWSDVSAAALTRFQKDEALAPPYTVALLTQSVDSRSGPGTAYAEANYYSPGTELNIAGQYGNWFLTTNGDYIPVAATADAVAVKAAAAAKAAQLERDRREKAAIAAAEAKTRAAAAAAKAAADAKAAAAATDKRIRAAITAATPIAIKGIIGQRDFPASGISPAIISQILTAVVGRIVTLATTALGGTPDR